MAGVPLVLAVGAVTAAAGAVTATARALLDQSRRRRTVEILDEARYKYIFPLCDLPPTRRALQRLPFSAPPRAHRPSYLLPFHPLAVSRDIRSASRQAAHA
jgi:hypothetical protein